MISYDVLSERLLADEDERSGFVGDSRNSRNGRVTSIGTDSSMSNNNHDRSEARDPMLSVRYSPPVDSSTDGILPDLRGNEWGGLLRTPQMWLSPSHPSYKQRKDRPSILSSTYNLTSTIIGAGVLALPYAFSGTGVVVGVLLLVFTAVLSRYSCMLLLSAYLRTHKASYDDLALHLFGPWHTAAVQWSVLLLNVGGTAGYMLVVKDLLAPSLCLLMPSINAVCTQGSHAVARSSFSISSLAVLMFGLVFPLACLESLSSLQIIGRLGFACAIFLAAAVGIRSVQALISDDASAHCRAMIWTSGNLIGTLRALPLFSFSFVCHLNVLPVYDELRSRSPARMRRVMGQAISFVTIYYGAVGVLGYLRFCDHTPHNILGSSGPSPAAHLTRETSRSELWHLDTNDTKPPDAHFFSAHDHLIVAARIAQTLTCTLALPFLFFPCRLVLHNMITALCYRCLRCARRIRSFRSNASSVPDLRPSASSSNGDAGSGIDVALITPRVHAVGASSDLGPCTSPLAFLSSSWMRYGESLLMITTSFSLALLVPSISVIFGFMGSTLCALICFILPAAFYLRSVTGVVARRQNSGEGGSGGSGDGGDGDRVGVSNGTGGSGGAVSFLRAAVGGVRTDADHAFKRAMAVFSISYGLFVMVVGTAINIHDTLVAA